ncbi:MAG: trigger factor [Oscillospiraceae bacterium]|nr:trigger factor [Oscillospiraceae bacterium]
MIKKILAAALAALTLVLAFSSCSSSAHSGDFYPYDLSGYLKLGDYNKIVYSPETAEVTDDEVEEKIKQTLESKGYSTQSEKTTAAQKGDIANIDYVGYIDGKTFEGGSSSGYSLELGSGTFIAGFEEGLIGKKAGEKTDLNLTFPENYHSKDFAGKEVVFKVTVNRVFEVSYPQLTDEIVSEISSSKTVKDYRKAVYDEILESETAEVEQNNTNKFIQDIIDCSDIKRYPKNEVKEYQQNLIKRYEMTASSQGLSLETFASYNGLTLDEFEELMETNAKSLVAKEMVFTLIAVKEEISISEEEYEDSLKTYAEENGYTDSQQFLDDIGEDKFRGLLIIDKTILHLKEKLLKK